MKRSLKAFTLIEVIVVIAIIGVMAALLVPRLISYLGDSKLSTANANAKLVYNCSSIFVVSSSSNGYTTAADASLSGVALTLPDDSVTSYKNDGSKEEHLKAIICQLGNQADASGVISVKIVENNTIEGALWGKSKADHYIGSFPTPSEEKTDSPDTIW